MLVEQKTAYKEATWIFCLSRLIILLFSYISVTFLHTSHLISRVNYIVLKQCSDNLNCFLLSWWRWDAVHYVEVAYIGYANHMPLSVFFPLFPLLVHGLGYLFGGSILADYTAAIILANVCFYGVLVLFYQLLYKDFGHTVAKYALIYLSFAPYGLFFFTGYTESLFLLLSLGVFFFLQRGEALDWWLAGLCGFLAALTRATGIVLLVPFIVLFVQRFCLHKGPMHWTPTDGNKLHNVVASSSDSSPIGRDSMYRVCWQQKLSALLSMVLVPAGLLIYLLYLWITFDNPLAFQVEEVTIWQRYAAFPWVGTIDAIKAILGLDQYFFSRNVADLAFTFVPLVALVIGWRRLPLHYSLFCLAMIVFVLSQPCAYEGLMSVPRYLLVVFPIFLLFALWSKNRFITCTIIALFLIFFIINIIKFVTFAWVA